MVHVHRFSTAVLGRCDDIAEAKIQLLICKKPPALVSRAGGFAFSLPFTEGFAETPRFFVSIPGKG